MAWSTWPIDVTMVNGQGAKLSAVNRNFYTSFLAIITCCAPESIITNWGATRMGLPPALLTTKIQNHSPSVQRHVECLDAREQVEQLHQKDKLRLRRLVNDNMRAPSHPRHVGQRTQWPPPQASPAIWWLPQDPPW